MLRRSLRAPGKPVHADGFMVRPDKTLAVLLAALALAACTEAPPERVVDLVVPVTVQAVGTGTIESVVDSTGSLRPVREAEFIAEVRGNLFYERLAAGRPEEGARVREGEPVARIESEEYVVGVRMESRQKAVENAMRQLEETQALQEAGLALESDVETVRKNLIDAESDLANSHIQLQKMSIVAPISGFLTELSNVTESTLVQQNDVIGKIVDYTQVLVDLNIPNSRIGEVRIGLPVRVVNFAFPDRTFEGRITIIDPALDATTRTFRVQATIRNPGLRLRPGMFVKAEIITEVRENVLVIARQLVLTRENRDVVFVEVEGRAEMRTIETGLEDHGRIEILEGLQEGERLITSNYETLRTRTPVRVTGQAGPGG